MSDFFRILALIFTLSTIGACQTAADDVDTATRFFNEVGFVGLIGGHPASAGVRANPAYSHSRIIRWEQKIRLHVKGPVEDRYRRRTIGLVQDLAALAGRPFSMSSHPQTANFTVIFTAEEGFVINVAEFASCYAHVEKSAGGISNVIIKISTTKPEYTARCITHEVLHGFGLVHANQLPSVMSYAHRFEEPTEWDRLAIRTLYDPSLKSGMTRDDALPLARQAIARQFSTAE